MERLEINKKNITHIVVRDEQPTNRFSYIPPTRALVSYLPFVEPYNTKGYFLDNHTNRTLSLENARLTYAQVLFTELDGEGYAVIKPTVTVFVRTTEVLTKFFQTLDEAEVWVRDELKTPSCSYVKVENN